MESYTFDAGGRLVRSRTYDEDGVFGKSTFYTLQGWRIIEEYESDQECANAGSAARTRQFVYGLRIDEVLAMDVDENGDGICNSPLLDSRYYYHANHLGSIYGLTDKTGALVEAVTVR